MKTTARLEAARAANKRTQQAMDSHQRNCPRCKPREKCPRGQTLVQRIWEAAREHQEAVLEAKRTPENQLTLDEFFGDT